MHKRYAELPTAFAAWVCPPAPIDQRQAAAELQRARISHFLPPILLIGLCATLTSFFVNGSIGGLTYIATRVMSQAVLISICLFLCHARRAHAAARVYCIWITASTLLIVLHPGLPQFVPTISSLLYLLLPVCSAGILLGARASWGYALAIGAIYLSASGQAIALSDKLALAQVLLVSTAIFALGMRGFHRALRAADRSDELAALNQQLVAGLDEIKAREREANEQHIFLQSTIDNISPDGFVVIDTHGNVIRCNDAFLDLLGWTRDEVIGRSLSYFYGNDADFQASQMPFLREMVRRGRVHFEREITTSAGHVIRLDCNMSWIPETRVFILIARDITERYVMEERLRVTLEESERIRRELETVIDNVQDALSVVDMDMQPMHINAATKKLFGFDDTYKSKNVTVLTQNYFHTTRLDGSPMQPEDYQIMRVLRGEAPREPTYRRVVRADGTASIVLTGAVPLNDASGRQFGALNISRDVTTEYYSARNMRIMQAVTSACSSTAEEIAVADAALIELLKGLDVPTGAIIVPDGKRPGYARLIAGRMGDGISADQQSALLAAIKNTPVASAEPPLRFLRGMVTGEPTCDTIPHQWKSIAPTLAEGQAITISSLPLTFGGAVLGLLVLCYNRQRATIWEESDSALATAAAGEIAISLHRARLYEEARRLALFDPLTGLHNHRAIQDILQRELTLGTAQSLPVSLIMLDIDHFRHLNETRGHDVGDRALRCVAQMIQTILGETGYAARYGGEEFAIILPGVDALRAHDIATDLLVAVAQCSIPAEATLSLTASLGHATFPIHASAPASLLKAADLALFAAKRAGRNRVVAYTPTLLEENARAFPTLITARAENLSEISLPSGAGLEAVQALITAVDLRDGYTAAHSAGVSRYSVAIAGEMRLPAEHIEALRMGGLVHDVGKIGTPDQILRKPGRLTDEEWVLMRAHTIMGEEILRHVEQLSHLLPLVRWHHERLDGSGYPDGLKGNEIPLLVRILSVADVFEAYTAERPYHPGRPASDGLKLLQHEVALNRMDSQVVKALEAILVSQGLVHMPLRGQNDLQEAA